MQRKPDFPEKKLGIALNQRMQHDFWLSLLSMVYSFESVFGEANGIIKMLQSLLSGGSACKFVVSLSQNG